jgi:hypothetical protein
MHIHHTEKLLSSRASSIMMMIIRELSEWSCVPALQLAESEDRKAQAPTRTSWRKTFCGCPSAALCSTILRTVAQGSALHIYVWMPSWMRQRTGPRKEAGKILQKLMGNKAGSQSMRCQM